MKIEELWYRSALSFNSIKNDKIPLLTLDPSNAEALDGCVSHQRQGNGKDSAALG
jgi:hypothetical protein